MIKNIEIAILFYSLTGIFSLLYVTSIARTEAGFYISGFIFIISLIISSVLFFINRSFERK